MRYRRYQSTYRRFPKTFINQPFFVSKGMETIKTIIQQSQHRVLALDVYPGAEVTPLLTALQAGYKVIHLEQFYIDSATMDANVKPYLTEDRVFGKMNPIRLDDYLLPGAIEQMRQLIATHAKPVLIYGLGASLIDPQALNVMVDCPRWELQLQYRHGGTNFHTHNPQEDPLRKYKRGFFLDWVIGDAHKFKQFHQFQFFIDVSDPKIPTMINQASMQKGIAEMIRQPFRLVPYFDPGVWGGQWMKEICDLPAGPKNYAWAFDGVPEENAVHLTDGHHVFAMPAQNLVYFGKDILLGKHVYERFGSHFPIRFDFLDTMQGGNLSLQVHPKTAYIQKEFGMPFTQDESYYILDCDADGSVYLGLKEAVDETQFWDTLFKANAGLMKQPDIESMVNHYPVKRHDHVSIPAGTIHCSGKNTMVLEISATPYIFTFKLWDWGRLGLDGLPRPVHLDHGRANLDFRHDTTFVEHELKVPPQVIRPQEEKTGLHASQFIETRRMTITKDQPMLVDNHESVNMLNLVEGEAIEIHDTANHFPPFNVSYAETFIVPASVKQYWIKTTKDHPTMVLQAYVRKL